MHPISSVAVLFFPGTNGDKDHGTCEFHPHPIMDHHHPEHHDNHVHFHDDDVNDDLEEDNGIRYKLTDPEKNIVTIHLGFLQIRHCYKLALQLPLDRCAATQKLAARTKSEERTIKLVQPESSVGLQSRTCKLLEYGNELDAKSSGEPILDLVVEFTAHKEKFVKEEMRLVLNDTDELTIIFTARVLGKGKGTPMLRNGIQSVLSVDVDDDESGTSSDATGVLH